MRSGFFLMIFGMGFSGAFILYFFSDSGSSYELEIDLKEKKIVVEQETVEEESVVGRVPGEKELFFPFKIADQKGEKGLVFDFDTKDVFFRDHEEDKEAGSFFILVPNASEKETSCYLIRPLSLIDHYITLGKKGLILSKFKNTDEFEKNSSFCLNFYEDLSGGEQLVFSMKNLEERRISYYREKNSLRVLEDGESHEELSEYFVFHKKEKGLENFYFKYKNLKGRLFEYEYDVNKKIFRPDLSIFDGVEFYQPYSMKFRLFTKKGFLSKSQIEPNSLRISRDYDIVTVDPKDSYAMSVIPVKALAPESAENCFSLVLLGKENFYLIMKNGQLRSELFSKEDSYKSRATFCLERDLSTHQRILNHDESLYFDAHTYKDGYVSFVPDSPYEENKTSFRFSRDHSFSRSASYLVFDNTFGDFVKYKYENRLKKFIRRVHNESKEKYHFEVFDQISLDNVDYVGCSLFNDKESVQYQSKNSDAQKYLIFDIDPSYPVETLTTLKCKYFGKNGVVFAVDCFNVGKGVSLSKECKAFTTKGDSKRYEIGEWVDIDFDAIFSVKRKTRP